MRVGIIGGGQLGMYLVDAAHAAGHTTIVLDPSNPVSASQNSDRMIVGPYEDPDCLKEMAENSDVITYEFENIKAEAVELVKQCSGHVPQGYDPLHISQNRLREKDAINKTGAKTAPYEELSETITIPMPYIIKTCEGGYDGKGQWLIRTADDLNQFMKEKSNVSYIVEGLVDFACEVSVIVIRSANGSMAVFEPIENIHEHGILHLSISPARVSEELKQKAKDTALQVMEGFGFTGILVLEMFVGKDGEIYINEIAPRPHNSGHLTMDAYDKSQYDLAISSLFNETLVKPEIKSPAVMVNVLGQHVEAALSKQCPSYAKVYMYGKKESKYNRKMGHVTFCGTDLEAMIQEAEAFIR